MKITLDSRKIKVGDIFVAAKGATADSLDGHGFIGQAVQNGASKVILEDSAWIPRSAEKTAFELVPNSRTYIAHKAEELAGCPSKKLRVFGITGTNGKSTVAHLAAQMCGGFIIGTLGYGDPNNLHPTSHTTPEAEDLSRLLAIFAKDGIETVFMEVSSHAISTHRIDGIHFSGVALTNLGQDHLDFHKSLGAYHRVKTDWVAKHPNAHVNAIQISRVDQKEGKTFFDLAIQGEIYSTSTKLIGQHNLENIETAAALALMAGMKPDKIASTIPHLTAPRGRMEHIHSHPHTFVDYAHTPDALRAALKALRPHISGRLIVVFGCGGDRDKEKRPLMGAVAANLADVVIVTDDNPRTEDAAEIRREVLSFHPPGLNAGAGVQKRSDGFPPQPGPDLDPGRERPISIADRRQAIHHAIKIATPSDVILIAGKGHEDYQIIGTKKYPFDDAEVARVCFTQNSAG